MFANPVGGVCVGGGVGASSDEELVGGVAVLLAQVPVVPERWAIRVIKATS